MLKAQNFSRARPTDQCPQTVLFSMVEPAFLPHMGCHRICLFGIRAYYRLQTRPTKHASYSLRRLFVFCWDGHHATELFLRAAPAALCSSNDGAFIALNNYSCR